MNGGGIREAAWAIRSVGIGEVGRALFLVVGLVMSEAVVGKSRQAIMNYEL